MVEFSKVLQLLCECEGNVFLEKKKKVESAALTTISTLLGSSIQFMTRINGFFFFFGQSSAGQMHLDVHLSMSRCLEEFADG